jgi:hypothetical protein
MNDCKLTEGAVKNLEAEMVGFAMTAAQGRAAHKKQDLPNTFGIPLIIGIGRSRG